MFGCCLGLREFGFWCLIVGLVVFFGVLFVVCGLVALVGWAGCLLVLLGSSVGCYYCCL